MTTNTSTKYDYITDKVIIQSESPAVCQLTPRKETIGSFKRLTLGEKDPNKTNKTILLLGETKTGKSALVNALVNYAMEVKWEDDFWFQMVDDEVMGQSESQESGVVLYQIFGFEGKTLPYSLTIIDTPGYGDTRGIEHDDIIRDTLLDLFRSADGIRELNTVGLVLKASENRLNDRLWYIFDSVASLFGNDMEKNVVALITYSDGRTPVNALKTLEGANVRCGRNDKNQPVHFLFDNCQNIERTLEDKVVLKAAWDLTMKGISQFMDFVEKSEPQMMEATMEVLNERIGLAASIRNLKEWSRLVEQQQEVIRQTQRAQKTHEEEMKNNENFVIEVDETYKVEEPFVRERRWWSFLRMVWNLFFYDGVTRCTVCEENCHYSGCTVAQTPSSCEVMKDGCCTVCTNKCPTSAHKKGNWIFIERRRLVPKTLMDMKQMYEYSQSEFQKTTNLLQNHEKTMEELQKNNNHWLEESFQRIVTLEQIALNAESLTTLVHLDFLIEAFKEKGDVEKVQKLEEIRHRGDKSKGMRAALQYVWLANQQSFSQDDEVSELHDSQQATIQNLD
ncbi:uncharacterized protein [Antennarius striatus]|uniref:uncharacterized protein n=1 Tax=Antennarius striatus TaxID=241820 RepID=UPI0035AE39B3